MIVTLDFETFYAPDYTLRKLSTSEYIRDPRFKIHGVGVKLGEGETRWVTGEEVEAALREIDWGAVELLAHNTAFDGFVLSHHFGIRPRRYLDTFGMALAALGGATKHGLNDVGTYLGLGAKLRETLGKTSGKETLEPELLAELGTYCVNDVELCYKIFHRFKDHFSESELSLIDMTLRMFCDPVLRVDLSRVRAVRDEEIARKTKHLLIHGYERSTFTSNVKFARLMEEEHGIEFERSEKGNVLVGKAILRELLDSDQISEQAKKLIEARLDFKSTLGETRAARLLEACKNGWSLPVGLKYWGAHTGRWSGANKLNLQNLPRGGELRKSILPPPGYVLVIGDQAQIEARITAWLAGQRDVVEAFAQGRDVYKEMASSIFGIPVDQIDEDARFLGKVCVLMLGFGAGHVKFHGTLKSGVMGKRVLLPLSQAKMIVDKYRSASPWITQLWRTMDQMLGIMSTRTGEASFKCLDFGSGYCRLPNGMFLLYPALDFSNGWSYQTRPGMFSKIYGGLLTENVVQALARCVVAEQMLRINAQYRVVTMTHDEIVCIAPEAEAANAVAFMQREMSVRPAWAPDLPVSAKVFSDICYSK